MKLPATAAALSLTLALSARAQETHVFSDPANLRGERVAPKTGLELPIDQGASGLQQVLRKLNTRASLMLIVAHPDDEDGGMLTSYSRGQGARVAMLTLTRGEGGQNAMTGDFEDALGLIRTQELLAADRYMGVDQMFGTEVDFGFSKTKEEAFAKWTHERVLYDAVRAVRLYRPLVIAAVFVGGVTDGHGQHQVSGEIAQEVFKAAGDPKVFPELTREGILPWQPLKMYARVPSFALTGKGLFDYATNQYIDAQFTNYVTGQTSATPPTPEVTIHEGATDSLLTSRGARQVDLTNPGGATDTALSYVQFARIGLGLQRTQIGANVRVPPAGAYDVSYHRFGSRLKAQPDHEDGFFEGIDTSLRGIASLSPAPPAALTSGLASLSNAIAAASRSLDSQHPEASAPALVTAQHQLGALLYQLEAASFPGKADVLHELRVKQTQLNEALTLALGLQFTATSSSEDPNVVQGKSFTVATHLDAHTADPVGVYAESLEGPGAPRTEHLLAVNQEPVISTAKPLDHALEATAAYTGKPTRPYFYRDSIEQPVYKVLHPELRNAPGTPAPVVAWATLRYRETEIQIGDVVTTAGQPVSIVPAATVSLPSHASVLLPGERSLSVPVTATPAGTKVQAVLPPGWKVQSEQPSPMPEGERVQVKLEASEPAHNPFDVRIVAAPSSGTQPHEGYRSVGYGNLPRTNFYTPATLRVVPVDLALPKHNRIGYLPGTGDAVADNLRSLGLPVTILTVADLTSARLQAFDTVILGVRTYNAHPDLHGAPTEALLAWSRAGGNVIVQYQTAEFTGTDAPFPLALGSAEKVVDENAPVQLLTGARNDHQANPELRALMYPNALSSGDFDGWIEERGHGFLQDWDPHYTALTETHDPGAPAEHVRPQLPQRGGLITTNLGRGHWTYCAFALYRQLPEAVPGAFRIFANLLGLADQP